MLASLAARLLCRLRGGAAGVGAMAGARRRGAGAAGATGAPRQAIAGALAHAPRPVRVEDRVDDGRLVAGRDYRGSPTPRRRERPPATGKEFGQSGGFHNGSLTCMRTGHLPERGELLLVLLQTPLLLQALLLDLLLHAFRAVRAHDGDAVGVRGGRLGAEHVEVLAVLGVAEDLGELVLLDLQARRHGVRSQFYNASKAAVLFKR